MKRTNADMVRNMSDSELATFLCDMLDCTDSGCPAIERCEFGHNGMLEWLKEEQNGKKTGIIKKILTV